jgi:hypothetical protein
MDRETLDNEGFGWVEQRDGSFLRSYQPPGAICSIAVADKSLVRAVRCAAMHPPTVRRTAVWLTSTRGLGPTSSEPLHLARRLGVGVVVATDGCATQLVSPAGAIQGRPAVFRWWQAELAYRNWLRRTVPTGKVALSG